MNPGKPGAGDAASLGYLTNDKGGQPLCLSKASQAACSGSAVHLPAGGVWIAVSASIRAVGMKPAFTSRVADYPAADTRISTRYCVPGSTYGRSITVRVRDSYTNILICAERPDAIATSAFDRMIATATRGA